MRFGKFYLLINTCLIIILAGCVNKAERSNPFDPDSGIRSSTIFARIADERDISYTKGNWGWLYGNPNAEVELYKLDSKGTHYLGKKMPGTDGEATFSGLMAGKYDLYIFEDCRECETGYFELYPYSSITRELYMYILKDDLQSTDRTSPWLLSHNGSAYFNYSVDSQYLNSKVVELHIINNDPIMENMNAAYPKQVQCSRDHYMVTFDFVYYIENTWDNSIDTGIILKDDMGNHYYVFLNTMFNELRFFDTWDAMEYGTGIFDVKDYNAYSLCVRLDANGNFVDVVLAERDTGVTFSWNHNPAHSVGYLTTIEFYINNDYPIPTNCSAHFHVDNIEVTH